MMRKNEIDALEAAKLLGVGRIYVYELLSCGRLKGRKVLDRWLIARSEVQRYRRQHP